MSKHLGNSPDPLVVVRERGADTLRFALLFPNPVDQDGPFGAGNARRGAELSDEALEPRPVRPDASSRKGPPLPPAPPTLGPSATLEDRWILSRWSQTLTEVDESTRAVRAHPGRRRFCTASSGTTSPMSTSRRRRRALSGTRRGAGGPRGSCHPRVRPRPAPPRSSTRWSPHVTEELWHALPHDGEALAVAAWPRADEVLRDPHAEGEMEVVLTAVRGIRALRSESKVPPSETPVASTVPASPAVGAILAAQAPLIARLARLQSFGVLGPSDARPATPARSVTTAGELFLHLEETGASAESLKKEREKLAALLEKARLKLAGRRVPGPRPPAVVAETEAKVGELSDRLKKIDENLGALGAPSPHDREEDPPEAHPPPERSGRTRPRRSRMASPSARRGRPTPRLGLGLWAIGRWTREDETRTRAALDRALARAVPWFDTAEVYGTGRSERFLGDALGRACLRNGPPFLTTKVSWEHLRSAQVRAALTGEPPASGAPRGRRLPRPRPGPEGAHRGDDGGPGSPLEGGEDRRPRGLATSPSSSSRRPERRSGTLLSWSTRSGTTCSTASRWGCRDRLLPFERDRRGGLHAPRPGGSSTGRYLDGDGSEPPRSAGFARDLFDHDRFQEVRDRGRALKALAAKRRGPHGLPRPPLARTPGAWRRSSGPARPTQVDAVLSAWHGARTTPRWTAPRRSPEGTRDLASSPSTWTARSSTWRARGRRSTITSGTTTSRASDCSPASEIDDHEFLRRDIEVWWRHRPGLTIDELETILDDRPVDARAPPNCSRASMTRGS